MTATPTLAMPLHGSRAEHVFPTLTAAQAARITTHGRVRQVERGEVLVEPGTPNVPLFAVVTARLEVVRPPSEGETIVATRMRSSSGVGTAPGCGLADISHGLALRRCPACQGNHSPHGQVSK